MQGPDSVLAWLAQVLIHSSELGHLQLRSEHTLDKSGIPLALVRLTNQFELLHDLELGVHFNDYTSRADSEV